MMKSGFTTLSKVLAICLSLGLLGGYVWWQSGVGKKEDDPDNESKGDVMMSGSKSAPIDYESYERNPDAYKDMNWPVEPAPEKPDEDEGITIMPGSKSGGVGYDDVPVLGDIPIVGRLFKKQEAQEPEPEQQQQK